MRKPLKTLPITAVIGVGLQYASRLERLGIRTVLDLLLHMPMRYEARPVAKTIESVSLGEQVEITGKIEFLPVLQFQRTMTTVLINDGTGTLTLKFFHLPTSVRRRFASGELITCIGEVRRGKKGFEMMHPAYLFEEAPRPIPLHRTHLPVYPLTTGISQKKMRRFLFYALKILEEKGEVDDWFEGTSFLKPDMPSLREALQVVHMPPESLSLEGLNAGEHPAQKRLCFEEMLAYCSSLKQLKQDAKKYTAMALSKTHDKTRQFLKTLPFQLTAAQTRVWEEIEADMESARPMGRVLQGDVGSGKTLVAGLALLKAAFNGQQGALMVPTALLAQQHVATLRAWFEPLGVRVGLLTGSMPRDERSDVLDGLQSGEVALVVGTHALFQEKVVFQHLALMVIDEQHRFGVRQRFALWAKGQKGNVFPHQLVMSATPIPRTQAMLCYSHFEHSVIDEMPPGRLPVDTAVFPEERRDALLERVKQLCEKEKAQIYWVCPLIEASDESYGVSVEEAKQDILKACPDLSVEVIHGRMSDDEKASVMQAFQAQEIDVLVATTVIEVGVNNPNARLMVIENPERLGLAQLHQLRGRVGRAAQQDFCVLMYHGPLSTEAQARLHCLRDCSDGFEIAERDLSLRGGGDLLGTQQAGVLPLRFLKGEEGLQALTEVNQVVDVWLSDYPERAAALMDHWLGSQDRYQHV